MSLPLTEHGLFYAEFNTDSVQVYASALVPATDPLWTAVRDRLATRPYIELPTETYRDSDMVHGQATMHLFAFTDPC